MARASRSIILVASNEPMEDNVLRDEYLALNDEQSVWPVLGQDRARQADPRSVTAPKESQFRSEAAAPDIPASIGMLLFGAYFALIAALAIATAGPGESKMVLTIAGLFVVTFFAVPRFIFAQEPEQGRRPSLSRFRATGMRTLTGHCTGSAAMVQMFVVPVALTFGMLAIAVEIALIF
jgi:hypothetical protein